MMRMRTKLTGLSPMNGNKTTTGNGGGGGVGDGGEERPENWELRPCGMLVQKRIDADQNTKPPPSVRVRVKYGSSYHEILINSQATFGELKKKLSGPTGLHHEDQKVYFKDKERSSKEFLDIVGVKDKSKLVVVEDPISQEKRYLEMKRNAKMEKAAKSISQISLEVDKLAAQVADLESVILKGGRVAETEVVSVIELLMNELIKLDGIVADGDVKLQRKMQVVRVQKYVETLDVLKAKNAMPKSNGVHMPNGNHQKIPNGHAKNPVSTGNSQIHLNNQDRASNGGKPPLPVKQQPKQPQRHSIGHSPLRPQPQRQEPTRHSTSGTVVTTQWETFESTPPLITLSPTRSLEATSPKPEKPKFPWEFFE
ncbi:BAG family molecular chaperone regulator 3-like [Silene latifolia]|uniref:BAG family molecular chaperone regulator 3-like n=1 Tax=Silene latifolia TaxID=37657 RepID=UPI003D77043C